MKFFYKNCKTNKNIATKRNMSRKEISRLKIEKNPGCPRKKYKNMEREKAGSVLEKFGRGNFAGARTWHVVYQNLK